MDLRHSRISRNLTLLLLWLFFAQVVLAARETFITLGEPLHIASGYVCLLPRDYRLVETWWRIAAFPGYAPSPMVHLVRADGTPTALGDSSLEDHVIAGSLEVSAP